MRPAPEQLVPAPVRSWLDRLLPDRLTNWWKKTFRDVTPRERWGYRVWGLVGAVIAVPEIWAAVAGDGPWPTISGTTGHLEELWSFTAVIVVAAIVMSAALAVGYGRPRGAQSPPPAPAPAAPEDSGGWWPYAYLAFAIAATVVAGFIASSAVDEGEEGRFVLGYVIYGLIGFFFLLLPGVFGRLLGPAVPFPSIFATVNNVEKRVPAVGLVVMAGLVVLLIHLALYPWPDVPHHNPEPSSL